MKIPLSLPSHLWRKLSGTSNRNISLEEGSYLAAPINSRHARVLIKRGARINGPMIVRGNGSLLVGQYAAVGCELHAITSGHDMTSANIQASLQQQIGSKPMLVDQSDVEIGPATWLGDRIILLPKSGIAAGCIVGAGSVVTKKFPPFSVLAGNPARLLRKRFEEEIINALLEISWWEWSTERLLRNRRFFELDLTQATSTDVTASIEP